MNGYREEVMSNLENMKLWMIFNVGDKVTVKELKRFFNWIDAAVALLKGDALYDQSENGN